MAAEEAGDAMGPCGDLCDCVQKDHVHELPLRLPTVPDGLDGDMCMTAGSGGY